MNNNAILMIVLVILLFASKSTVPPVAPVTSGASESTANSDVKFIDSSVSFTGKEKYVGTLLTTDYVRAIRFNGGTKDLGFFSLNNGALSTTPNEKYKFYFFMNTTPSSTYYVDVQDYTAPVQESVDPQVGVGCRIDTSPTFYVKTNNGQVQSATANAQSMANGDTATITAVIVAHSQKCYGTPKISGKNALCLLYNATVFNLYSSAPFVASPYPIASNSSAATKAITCYGFNTLLETEAAEIPITLTANVEATSADNITVMADDIGIDIDLDTTQEIIGYVDEDNNQLAGNAIQVGKIYVS